MSALAVHRGSARAAVGALLVTTLFDVLTRVAPEPYTFTRPGRWSLAVGLVAGALASGPALLAEARTSANAARRRALGGHVVAVDAGLVLYAASFGLRWGEPTDQALGVAALLTSLLGAVGLALGAVAAMRLRTDPATAPALTR